MLLKLVCSLNLNAISIHSEEAYPLSLTTYSFDLSNNPKDPFKLVLNVYAASVLYGTRKHVERILSSVEKTIAELF